MPSKSPDAFRTISEAAEEVGTPQHVLRFWEGRLSFIQPLKRAGGRRFYRPQDIAVLKAVRRLLHDEGLTLKGVQRLHREQGLKRLVSYADPATVLAFQASPEDGLEAEAPPAAAAPAPALDASRRRRLQDVLERIERARRRLETALARSLQKRAPTLPGGWQLEAEVHQSLADRKAAVAAWRTAIDKGATGEAAVQLHRLLLADDPAAAEAMARQWRASQPRDAFFVTHLAETAALAGQRAQAEAHYREALALVPDHVGVLNNLADLLVRVRPQEALALALRAATLAPAEAAVLDTLASAQAASGQLAAALSTQQRAVAFAPGDPRLRLHLGRLWLDSGDKDKAREQLRRAEQAADPAVRDAAGALLRQAG